MSDTCPQILDSSLTSLFPLGDSLGLRLSPQLSPFPFCLCPYDMRVLPLAGSLFTTLSLGLSHLVPALFLEILYSYRQMFFKRSPFPPVLSLVCSRSFVLSLSPSLAGTGTNHGLLHQFFSPAFSNLAPSSDSEIPLFHFDVLVLLQRAWPLLYIIYYIVYKLND